ncbi:hypothetical protein LPJ74_006723, partial [Coemansia sp. RSA 1843]
RESTPDLESAEKQADEADSGSDQSCKSPSKKPYFLEGVERRKSLMSAIDESMWTTLMQPNATLSPPQAAGSSSSNASNNNSHEFSSRLRLPPTSLSIILDTPSIHIHGEQRPDSAGAVPGGQVLLTGRVELQLRTAVRIRFLELSFFGEQITRLPPHTVAHTNTLCRSRCLADIVHDPPLIRHSADNAERYASGTHRLPFRLMLPADLPTSAVLSFGHVRYAVRARLAVAGLRRAEYVAEEPVAVVRCPGEGSEWAFSAFDALSVGTHWDGRTSVTLSHSTCALGADTGIQLGVDIAAMQKQFSLLVLEAAIHETQCAFGSEEEAPNPRSVVRKETRIVAHNRLAFGQSGLKLSDSNRFDVELQIPQAPEREGIQYSCASEDIRVTHRLVLTALIKSPEGPVVEMALPARVWVLPQAAADRGRESALPLYEHAEDDQLVEAAGSMSATSTAPLAPTPSELPPYSLPVCLSCGKEDISVLECQ